MSSSSFDPVAIPTSSAIRMLEVSDGVYLQGKELEEYCLKNGMCNQCGKVKVRRKVKKVFGSNKWEPITTVKVSNNGIGSKNNGKANHKRSKNYMTVKAKIESGQDDNVEYLVYKGYCLREGCYTLEQAKRLSGNPIESSSQSIESSKSFSSNQSANNNASNNKRGKLFGGFRRRSSSSKPATSAPTNQNSTATPITNPDTNPDTSFLTQPQTSLPLTTVGEIDSDVQSASASSILSPVSRMTMDPSADDISNSMTGEASSSYLSEHPLPHLQIPDDNHQFPAAPLRGNINTSYTSYTSNASSEDLSVVPSPEVRKNHEHEFAWGSRGSPKKRYYSRHLWEASAEENDELAPRSEPIRQVVAETIEALQGLSAAPFIRTLDLSGLKLRRSEMEALARLFRTGKNGTVHLTSLILNNCGVDDSLMEIIAQALYDALFTANNRIGINAHSSSNTPKLSKSMRHARMRLRSLDLGDNDIGDKGIDSLCLYLESISCELENLDLSRNSIETSGGIAIFDALKRNPQTKIEAIDLSCNLLRELEYNSDRKIGIPGHSSGIHGFLSKNKTLKELDLSTNRMTDEWVEALCRGLSLNDKSALEHLSLGFNRIGNRGAVAIGMCLTVNKSLVLLELNDNHIENDGAEALLDAIEDNSTIKDIAGLWSNKIDKRHIIVSIRQMLVSDNREKRRQRLTNHANGPKNDDYSDDDSEDIYITSDSESTIPPPESVCTLKRSNSQDDLSAEVIEESNPLEEGFLADENENITDFLSVQDSGDLSDLSDQDDEDSETYESLMQEDYNGIGMETPDGMMETNQEVTHNMFDRMTIMNSSPLVCFDDKENVTRRGIPLLDTIRETEAIKAAVEAHHPTRGSRIEVKEEMATLDKFKAFFSAGDSSVLHISCHLFEEGIALEDGYGSLEKLSLRDLKEMISECGARETLELIFVSSPSALKIGRVFIEAGVKHVLCCQRKDSFRDPIAVHFMESFYEHASERKPLKESFDAALRTVVNSSFSKKSSLISNRFHLLPLSSANISSTPVFFQRFIPHGSHHTRDEDIDESLQQRLENRMNDILPPLPDYFLGREIEIFKFLEALQVSDCVEISGIPGCGKDTIIGSSLEYALKRSETFSINQVCWIPAQKRAMVDPDSLYGDLMLCCDLIRDSSEDLWDLSEEVLDCRERLGIELEVAKVVVVIDKKSFLTTASRTALEKLIHFIVTSSSTAKVVCISSTSTEAVNENEDSDFSSIKRSTIEIDNLELRSTALLFGEISKHVARSSKSSIAWSRTEFAELVDIPFIAPTKGSSTEVVGVSTRRTEILELIGNGNPAQVISSAKNMSPERFDSLMKVVLTPEISIDTLGALQNEVQRRSAFMDLAIKDGNYKRSIDLEAKINELDAMKAQFCTLKELKAKEKSMKSELANAISNRRYDVANELKRDLIILKKKIMKERRVSTTRTGENPNGVLSDLKFQVDSLVNTLEHGDTVVSNEEMKALNVDCDGHTCTFLIHSSGTLNVEKRPMAVESKGQSTKSKRTGIICWSNEACELNESSCWASLLGDGFEQFKKRAANLPIVENTRHGPVRGFMGKSIILDTSSSSSKIASGSDDNEERLAILTVGPFFTSSGQIDVLLERDEEFRRFSLATLRSCYRSCVQQTERAKLQNLVICPLTTRAKKGPLYEETLRMAVREILEGAKFSKGLHEVRLVGETPKETALLVGIIKSMGYSI